MSGSQEQSTSNVCGPGRRRPRSRVHSVQSLSLQPRALHTFRKIDFQQDWTLATACVLRGVRVFPKFFFEMRLGTSQSLRVTHPYTRAFCVSDLSKSNPNPI